MGLMLSRAACVTSLTEAPHTLRHTKIHSWMHTKWKFCPLKSHIILVLTIYCFATLSAALHLGTVFHSDAVSDFIANRRSE